MTETEGEGRRNRDQDQDREDIEEEREWKEEDQDQILKIGKDVVQVQTESDDLLETESDLVRATQLKEPLQTSGMEEKRQAKKSERMKR